MLSLVLLLDPATAAPSWTVTVDPLTTALGFVHVQVERTLAPDWSLYAGPSLKLFDGLAPDIGGPYIGLGAEAGLRWFPRAEAPRGPWVMLRGVGAQLRTTDGTDLTELGGYTSLLGGGTAILGERWVLAGGLGVSLFSYTIGGYGVEGVIPAAHTNLGFAF